MRTGGSRVRPWLLGEAVTVEVAMSADAGASSGRCLAALLFVVLVVPSGCQAITDAQIAQIVLARLELIDIDRLLDNARILDSYIRCMLHRGPCSPEGRDFRSETFTQY
ncbi:hypothetical protein AAG570_007851 [Ranatra chinensis]|uniref:Uncharacterized protein n=1 Tax=Ranatra chinensis TaxID=642074 RepID=A0ABD0XT62_9HEMI